MIDFKTDRVKSEYAELLKQNQRLYRLVECIAQFTDLEFKKPVFITSILRTEAEHKGLYKDVPNPPPMSPHCYWRGVDLRSSIYTENEIQRIVKFANCFLFHGGAKVTALYHTLPNNALHLHIQYA